MSSPKLIKIRSTTYLSPDNKLTNLASTNYSIDSKSQNHQNCQNRDCRFLLTKIQKLSKDNDRLWRLLVENTDEHKKCEEIEKKIKNKLDQRQKQLLLYKQMYNVQKSNFQQEKKYYSKRQQQWIQIVGSLKKIILDYQQTNSIDLAKTSEIFCLTNSKINLSTLPNLKESTINRSKSISIMKNINKNKNEIVESKLINGCFESELVYEDRQCSDKLTKDEIFERALRRTYLRKHTVEKLTANDILKCENMQKLKNAKSSTRQRLKKTVRKIFVYDTVEQLEQIIKYLQDKVYERNGLVRGDLLFNLLKQKFIECEQIFYSTNSTLDRLDASQIVKIYLSNCNQKLIESLKFTGTKQYSQKNRKNRVNSPIMTLKNLDTQNEASFEYSGLVLNIDSNIKHQNDYNHFNNHIQSQVSSNKNSSHKMEKDYHRDQSKKNIYTQKRVSRKNFVENVNKNKNNQSKQSKQRNLSSLIGVNQEYDLK